MQLSIREDNEENFNENFRPIKGLLTVEVGPDKKHCEKGRS
jgi:hypothetical protein